MRSSIVSAHHRDGGSGVVDLLVSLEEFEVPLRVRTHRDRWADITLFGDERDRIRPLLTAEAVDAVRHGASTTRLRFTRKAIAQAGEAFAEDGTLCSRALSCKMPRILVTFCDPNATKALHVGHMRHLAL